MLLDGEHLIAEALASGLAIEVAAFGERLADVSARAPAAHAARRTVIVSPIGA